MGSVVARNGLGGGTARNRLGGGGSRYGAIGTTQDFRQQNLEGGPDFACICLSVAGRRNPVVIQCLSVQYYIRSIQLPFMVAANQRAKHPTLIKFVPGSDSPLRRCHGCDFRPIADFHPSSIRSGIYECRSCATTKRAAHSKSERARHAHSAAEIRKREGVPFTADDVSRVIKAFHDTCFVTGAMTRHHAQGIGPASLTLIRADASAGPIAVANCAPCLRSTSKRLAFEMPPHLLPHWRARVEAAGLLVTPAPEATQPPAGVTSQGAAPSAGGAPEVAVLAATGANADAVPGHRTGLLLKSHQTAGARWLSALKKN